MKTSKLLTIIMISVLLLCGCSKKMISVDSDKFLKLCEDYNIEYEDVGSSYGFANEAIQMKGENYNILYIETNNITDSSGMFYDDINNIFKTSVDENNNEVDNKIKKGKNWKSLESTINDIYYYLIYVDNTYLYIKATNKDVETVKTLRKAMNY